MSLFAPIIYGRVPACKNGKNENIGRELKKLWPDASPKGPKVLQAYAQKGRVCIIPPQHLKDRLKPLWDIVSADLNQMARTYINATNVSDIKFSIFRNPYQSRMASSLTLVCLWGRAAIANVELGNWISFPANSQILFQDPGLGDEENPSFVFLLEKKQPKPSQQNYPSRAYGRHARN